jgi:hypothetical protein
MGRPVGVAGDDVVVSVVVVVVDGVVVEAELVEVPFADVFATWAGWWCIRAWPKW